MKVKELIKILESHNPEHYVGRYSIGQDTGDWYTFDSNEIIIMPNKEDVDLEELEKMKSSKSILTKKEKFINYLNGEDSKGKKITISILPSKEISSIEENYEKKYKVIEIIENSRYITNPKTKEKVINKYLS